MAQPTHSGAVVFESKDGQTQFLVIASSNGLHWVLPKGHIEPGETAEAAALRELQEEAGIDGEIVAPLGVRQFKKYEENAAAQYFLVKATGTVAAQECRALRWEDLSTAMELLSFAEAKEALQEGAAVLRAKP
ncbi:MAG: NUDIX domain-containing protein [Desulfobacteraceae bacterium]|nr:NUDIX domain-containing protein [Desulfobacteraceae bacterium]